MNLFKYKKTMNFCNYFLLQIKEYVNVKYTVYIRHFKHQIQLKLSQIY